MDANTEHRRAATASEAQRDPAAGPEPAGADPIVLIDVQPDGALDLFGIEQADGSVDRAMVLDPLDQFTPETSARDAARTKAPIAVEAASFEPSFEPPFEPSFEPSFDAAAEAVAVRLAATVHHQPSSWPARRGEAMDVAVADRRSPIRPRSLPVAKPAAWFDSRRFWVAVMVVGLVAAAAVPGMAILSRAPASAPTGAVQSASMAPRLADQPATIVPAASTTEPSPEPLSRIVPPPVPQPATVRSSSLAGAVREPPLRASDPAAKAGQSPATSLPPASTPDRNPPPSPAAERTAAANPAGNRNVPPPPATRGATTATTGLPASAAAVAPQSPPASRPAALPEAARPATPSATLSGPSVSPASSTRLETGAAAPSVTLPPVTEPSAALPPPALPAAAPAAAPRASAAIPLARASDNEAIQTTLGRYRTAFSGLDANAAGAVWPSVDQKALGRAFARLEQQTLTFANCVIDVRGVRAVATCKGTADYVPKVGNKNARIDARQWVFNLRKVDEQWLIDAVNSR